MSTAPENRFMTRLRRTTLAAAIALGVAGPAIAQDTGFLNWTPGTFALTEGRVGLGVGMAPDYLGSDDMVAIPLPSFAFSIGEIPIQNNLLGVEIDIRPGFPAPPRGQAVFAYGPILRYDSGRNDGTTVEDPVVALTTPVPGTPEIGGFLEATLPLARGEGGPVLLTARLAILQATQSHEGGTADLSVGLVRPMGRWTLGGGVAATWADGDYTQAFFDVSAVDAAATGLPAYTASGGLLTAGGSLFLAYALTEAWSVNLLTGYTLVTGSAADSPLVTDRGQPQQVFAGLGLNFRF
jgi:outer membrane protein